MNSTAVILLNTSFIISLVAAIMLFLLIVKSRGSFVVAVWLAAFAAIPFMGSIQEYLESSSWYSSQHLPYRYALGVVVLIANMVAAFAHAKQLDERKASQRLKEESSKIWSYSEPTFWAPDNDDPPRR